MNDPKPTPITTIEESEWAAFRTLWTYMNKKSYVSNLWLRDFYAGPYFLNVFAHVLPKKKYPYFRYYLRNIVLLTPSEHVLYDHGTIEQRETYAKTVKTADWTRLGVLKESLLGEYNSLFPTRRGLMIGIKYSEGEVRDVVRKLNALFLTDLIGASQPILEKQKKKDQKKKQGKTSDKG